MSRVLNSLGVPQNTGTRVADTGIATTAARYGHTEQVVLTCTYKDINAGVPSINAESDASQSVIPANSFIKSVLVVVQEDVVGGSVAVGLSNTDGTSASPAALATTAADVAGTWVVGDGASVGVASGAADRQINVVGAGLTEGKVTIIVEYVAAAFG